MNNGEPIGVNGEQRGATGGVNGEATVSNGWQWGSISHLRGAMLNDVRLNRRDVRVDLVGRGKLVRGLVRRKKEDDTELGVALPYSPYDLVLEYYGTNYAQGREGGKQPPFPQPGSLFSLALLLSSFAPGSGHT